MNKFAIIFTLLVASLSSTAAFVTPTNVQHKHPTQLFAGEDDKDLLEIELSMPPTNSNVVARLRFPPVFPGKSEIVEVRYKLPFGLSVEPQNNLAMCTKDGPGGEKVGDVLRYTSQWTMGIPQGDGIVTTAASFSGAISWQCNMFDVMKAKDWSRVVEALTSNVEVSTVHTAASRHAPYNITYYSDLGFKIHKAIMGGVGFEKSNDTYVYVCRWLMLRHRRYLTFCAYFLLHRSTESHR